MPTEKVLRILRSKSNFSEDQILAMSDQEAWAWIYRNPKEPKEKLDQICFTGFSPADKAELELKAKGIYLNVVSSVTKNLNYLCIGPNAGPAKLEKAKEQNTQIITVSQFSNMVETGVIPAE